MTSEREARSAADDIAAVLLNIRAACIAAKNAYPGSKWNDPEEDPELALARLAALLAATEAERDEARRNEAAMRERYDSKYVNWTGARDRAEAAEAREKALREALLYARDCIASPDTPFAQGKDIYDTHMMMGALRRVDAALAASPEGER